MVLKEMNRAMRMELSAKRNICFFQEAKKRHAVLDNHETGMSVLAILKNESPDHWKEKDAIVRAIIEESQKRPHSFWGTLLFLAFYPMLSRLRSRIKGDAMTRDDLDQTVLSAFLEVVQSFPLEKKVDRTCLHLRQMTERLVFKGVQKEQRAQKTVRSADFQELECREVELANEVDMERLNGEHHLRWPETTQLPPRPFSEEEKSQLEAFLVEKIGDAIKEDRIYFIIATMIHGKRLSDLVRDRYPDASPEERKRLYQSLKRCHSRTLENIRELLVDFLSPTRSLRALRLRKAKKLEGGKEK